MFKKIFMAVMLAVMSIPAVAQQFQTSDLPPITPLYLTNAKYVNGWSPGYAPTGNSTGLTLTLSSGTNFVTNAIVTYPGGTLSLTDASTNYVYLDNTGTPAFNTSGFIAGESPIAVVVTSGGNISSITDVRSFFFNAGGTGPCSIYNTTSTICGTSNNATPQTASQEYGYENNLSNTTFSNVTNLVTIGNNNTQNSTGTDVINIGDTVAQADSSSSSSSLLQTDTIIMGDNSGQTFTHLGDVIAIGDFELSGVAGSDITEDMVAIGDQGAEGVNNGTNVMVCIGFAPCQNLGIGGAATESVFIGDSAGQDSVGTENIGIGDGTLRNIHGTPAGTVGNSNIAMGLYALGATYSGSDNIAIGSNAGCVGCTNSSNGPNANTTGSHNVWIGDTAGQSVPSSTEIDNSIAIGYQVQNDATNQTKIGNASTVSLKLFGCPTGETAFDDGSGTCFTPSSGGGAHTGSSFGYTFYVSGGTYSARNNITGTVDYSGTDFGPVINSALTNTVSTYGECGHNYIANGTYNFNSFVAETVSGFTNYYAVGIPSGSASGQYCLWTLEGESTPDIRDQLGSALQTSGVILNITSTAISSVSGTPMLDGIWVRPVSGGGVASGLALKNVTVRFPNNQRGNETGVDATQASNTDFEQVAADTAVTQSSLAFPVAGSIGMYGITTTGPVHEENYWRNVYAIGYDTCLDVQSEHSILVNSFGLNCNNQINVGVRNTGGGTVGSFPRIQLAFINAGGSYSVHGVTFGSQVVAGSYLFASSFDFEDATSGIWTNVYHMKENTAGNLFGSLTYNVWNITSGTINNLANVFDGGGGTNVIQNNQTGTLEQGLGGSFTSSIHDTFANSASSGYIRRDFCPNLGTSNVCGNEFGVAEATNNSFQQGFHYIGSGSTSNYVTGNFKSSAIANYWLFPSGGVQIGGTTPTDPGANNLSVNGLTASELVQTDANKKLISTTALPSGTTAITQSAHNNSTLVATTAYVDAASTGSTYVNVCSLVPGTVTLTNATCSGGLITVTSGNSTFTVSGLPGSYIDLEGTLNGSMNGITANAGVSATFNSDTSSHYSQNIGNLHNGTWTNQTGLVANIGAGTSMLIADLGGTAEPFGAGRFIIPSYASTTVQKAVMVRSVAAGSSTTQDDWSFSGFWTPSSAAAITSITFTAGSGNFVNTTLHLILTN